MDGESEAKARILVVDDSKLMRKAAHKMLGEEFDVVTADDGEQAWAQLGDDASIQVVFTDLNMPNVDGYDLLRRVRSSDNGNLASIPVIVVTGAENDEAARMRALDMGATDFITKPFTTVDLVARARAHANNQRITRRLHAQATVDALTGLANLGGFVERLQQDIAYARRHRTGLSVVRLEVVDFRRLFLYHGRKVADALVLLAGIRKEDTGGRVGLGGFALSLPAADAAGIEAVIARLREDLLSEPPVDEEGLPIAVVVAAAFMAAELTDATTAKSLLAQCEMRLAAPQVEIAQATAAALVVATPAPAAEPSAPPAPPAPPAVSAAPAPQAVPPPPVLPAVAALAVEPVAAQPEALQPAAPAPDAVASAAAEPLRLDPLLDQLAAGNTRAVSEKLPQVIGRLLPIFRLLGPNQRAQLVQFLQRLG
jgi:DNA-binding response OmpR family regulator